MSASELLVKTYLYDVCPWVKFNAENSRKITYEESNEIISRMSAKFQAKDLDEYSKALSKLLIENGLAGENRNPVSLIFSPDRVRARINERAILIESDLKMIDAGFMLALDSIDDFSLSDLKTMILYSAMRFGLLLNKDYINQFNHCLNQAPHYYKGHIWYELKIPEIDNIHIWNPDALTMALLGKWYERDLSENQCEFTKLDIFKEIKALFKFKQSRLRFIRSSRSLENGIAMLNANEIPAYINDVSKGEVDSRTVNRECYIRLITGKSPKLSEIHSENTITGINKSALSSEKNDDVVIKNIKMYLNNEDTSDISNSIKNLIYSEESNIEPIVGLLGRWVAQRLTGKNYWGNKTSRKTIKSRFNYISQDLIDVFEDTNPVKLSAEELCELYYEIVENRGATDHFKKALEDFHYYIQEHEAAAKIYNSFPWSKKQKYQPVDANIVTLTETKAIEEYYWGKLKNIHITPDERQLMSLRLIVYALGFYTGMRRQEIIGGRLGDITTVGRQIYNVREHKNKSVKSSNAIRQLPIWIYLPKDILKLLNRYLKHRVDNGAKPDDYLFDLSGNEVSTRIHERLVFNHIHWVMQGITGHAKARFHHLRHSCGTWMLWKLSLSYLSNKRLGFTAMPEYTNDELMVYQENLLGHSSLKYPSEKIVPEMARMLGHSNGGMSLGIYVHSVHWISNDYREKLAPSLMTSSLAKLAGISVRQIQKLADNNDAPLRPDLIKRTVLRKLSKLSKSPDLSGWVSPTEKTLGNYGRELNKEKVIEFDIWNALLEYFEKGTDKEILLTKFDIEGYEFDRYIQNAKRLFGEGKDGRTVLYKLPPTRKELKTAELMLVNYHGLSDAKKKPVHIAVDYFKANSTSNGVVFNDKEQLSEYLKLFDSLKLWKSVEGEKLPAFRLTLSSCHRLESSEREQQWVFWKRTNNFQSYQLSNKLDDAIVAGRGSLLVDYMSEKPKKASHNTNRQTDRGFILGMYILATIYVN